MTQKKPQPQPVKLSRGNIKVQDTLIFNLPALLACPFATDACKMFCYAKKAEIQYPSANTRRRIHFEASFKDDFADLVIEQIERENRLKIKRDAKKGIQSNGYEYFRIHESGDFYNQKYVNQWAKIAAAFPNMKFLAFTKSFPYNFEALKALPNVRIRYSIDKTSKAIRTDMPLAIVQDGTENRKKTFACNAGMKCADCRVCWNSKIDVGFELH